MNSVSEFTYPAPSDSDLEEVHCALSVGATLWTRGDEDEALKWLRRAAEAAADGDEDLRAVELFKAAADITTTMENREEDSQTSRQEAPRSPSPPKAGKWSAQAARKMRVHRRFSEEDQEATMVRPETALRRALTRIDPSYPKRIDLHEDEAQRQSSLPGPTSDPFGHTPEPQSQREPDEKSGPSSSVTNALQLDDLDDDLRLPSQSEIEPAPVSRTSELPVSSVTASPVEPPSAPDDPPGRGRTLSVDAAATAAESVAIGDAHRAHANEQEAFPALRVALMTLPDEGEIRLLFIAGDEKPPPGVTTGLLVATTPQEARLLRELHRTTEAKL